MSRIGGFADYNSIILLSDYSLTERQFAQLLERSKMYQYLSVRYIETRG
ncbi:MAG: hypothetical protein NTY95_08625 [Bacteroidia bacterium]|nr:hypothetical protein [Bacteroidia bacterium]